MAGIRKFRAEASAFTVGDRPAAGSAWGSLW